MFRLFCQAIAIKFLNLLAENLVRLAKLISWVAISFDFPCLHKQHGIITAVIQNLSKKIEEQINDILE